MIPEDVGESPKGIYTQNTIEEYANNYTMFPVREMQKNKQRLFQFARAVILLIVQ